MNFCDLSLPSPEENLACDEALLELAEEGRGRRGCFAFGSRGNILSSWVIANQAAAEVNLPFCSAQHHSGIAPFAPAGGTVLQGPVA